MDLNTFAKSIVDQAVGDKPVRKSKTNAANAGIARAKALTPEKRSEIAAKAAAKRWSAGKPGDEYSSEPPALFK